MAAPKPPHQTEPSTQIELSQALASAIFVPFQGFNTNACKPSPHVPSSIVPPISLPIPLDPASKLEKILELLPQQQDVVRNQMLGVIIHEAEDRKTPARRAIERLNEGPTQRRIDKAAIKKERREVDEMLQCMMTPAQSGQSYELHPTTGFLDEWNKGLHVVPERDTDGDIIMQPLCAPLTTRKEIRQELAQELQILVMSGVQKIDEYDVHCQSVRKPYANSLARKKAFIEGPRDTVSQDDTPRRLDSGPQPKVSGTRSVKFAPPPSVWATSDVGRLSNGMPVSLERLPERKMESLEELARRSNK